MMSSANGAHPTHRARDSHGMRCITAVATLGLVLSVSGAVPAQSPQPSPEVIRGRVTSDSGLPGVPKENREHGARFIFGHQVTLPRRAPIVGATRP